MNSFDKSNHLQLRWEVIVLVFLSIFLHLVGLWFLGKTSSVETDMRGRTETPNDRKSIVAVRFLVNRSSEFQLGSILENVEPLASVQKIDFTTKKTTERLLPGDVSQTRESYSPSGRLTRMPSPVIDIDLNVAEIDAAAMAVVIELTVLVKSDGTVADVSTFMQDDKARHFADLIASRFLSARFSPGEIDGKAVNAEFKVTVISEPVATPSADS